MPSYHQKHAEHSRCITDLAKLQTDDWGCRVLLFGTSIVKHLNFYENVWRNNLLPINAFNHGVSGDHAKDTHMRICETFSFFDNHYIPSLLSSLTHVLIHTGSNDASDCQSVDSVVSTIMRCIQSVIVYNPFVNIIVSSLLPRLRPKNNCHLDMDENQVMFCVNAQLRHIFKAGPIKFMENWSILNPNPSFYIHDGIHLNQQGNETFAVTISDTIASFPLRKQMPSISAHSCYAACSVLTKLNIPESSHNFGQTQLYDTAMKVAMHGVHKYHSSRGVVLSCGKMSQSLGYNPSKTPSKSKVAFGDAASYSVIPVGTLAARSHSADALINALTHYASLFLCASLGIDHDMKVLRVLSTGQSLHRCDISWLRKSLLDSSSDDTDCEPEFVDRSTKKKLVKKKGYQPKCSKQRAKPIPTPASSSIKSSQPITTPASSSIKLSQPIPTPASSSIKLPHCVSVKKFALSELGFDTFKDWVDIPGHVYIGRDMSHRVEGAVGSKWGNPFKVNANCDLTKSLHQYEHHVRTSRLVDSSGDEFCLVDRLIELAGKQIGCWCKPYPCHGDVLIKLFKEFCLSSCKQSH